MIRNAVRPALRNAVRPAIGWAPGPATNPLTPLQQATLAAWDMQESSGPLLPAKGDIEISAFNSPGTTTGPAAGISARNFDASSTQYFAVADDPIFRAPSSGVKTIRFWARNRQDIPGELGLVVGKTGSGDFNASGDEWGAINNGSTGEFNTAARDSADSGRFFSGQVSGGSVANQWDRVELVLDADSDTITLRYWNSVSETETVKTGTVTGGFLIGTNQFSIGAVAADGDQAAEMDMSTLAIFDRALTTEERTADLTPRLYADL